MTERIIIRALYKRYIGEAGHKYAIHNTTGILPKSGEADFVTVNQNSFVSEIEVKVSRSDFKADFRNKKRKHIYLNEAQKHVTKANGWLCMPNYFYFAVPEGMVSPNEVPEKYGLIYVKENHLPVSGTSFELRVVKKAKQLHKNKITPRKTEEFAHLLSYRVMKLL
jgi:hypothetical protein